MAMSLWRCDKAGCKSTAVGKGSSIGLRAVGWYFKASHDHSTLRGPDTYCPAHRPDGIECKQRPGVLCSDCAAERDARRFQPGVMTREELDNYQREILPILERHDEEFRQRRAEGRTLYGMEHDR